jgi:hypothetical protein
MLKYIFKSFIVCENDKFLIVASFSFIVNSLKEFTQRLSTIAKGYPIKHFLPLIAILYSTRQENV